MIIAIDPGTEQSAYAIMERTGKASPLPANILEVGIKDNQALVDYLYERDARSMTPANLHIEMVASYGMPVGKHVFETCVWIGRFIEAIDVCGHAWSFVYRKDVKMHLCFNTKAKDSNIRQAIMDKYGSTRDKAIGTKKKPGPLYGVSKDMWAAIGVGLTALHEEKPF